MFNACFLTENWNLYFTTVIFPAAVKLDNEENPSRIINTDHKFGIYCFYEANNKLTHPDPCRVS